MNRIRKALIVVAVSLAALPALLVFGASKIAIHDGRIVKGAEEGNGDKKKYFFMGPAEKYDLTRLERLGKPARSEP